MRLRVGGTLALAFYSLLLAAAGSASSAFAQDIVLTEDQSVTAALAISPELQKADAEVRRAEAGLLAARPLLPSRPIITGQYETGRPFNDPDQRLSVGVSQEVEIAGQRSIRRAIAEADVERARLAKRVVERKLGLQLRMLYARVSNLYQQHVLNDSLIVTAKRATEAAQRRLTAGDIAQLDYNTVRLDELRQLALHDQVHAEYEGAIAELGHRTGRHLDVGVRLIRPDTVILNRFAGSFDSLVLLNPEWQMQEQEIQRLHREHDLILAEQIPNPTIGIGFTKSTLIIDRNAMSGDPAILDRISEIRKSETSLGLSLSIGLPLQFGLWPTGSDRIARNDAEIDIAKSEQAIVHQEMAVRVAMIQKQIARLQKSITELNEASDLAVQNTVLLERGYIAGELPVTTYLSGRQQLFDMQNRSLQLDHDLQAIEAEITSMFSR